ncbi:MAG TPA: redoxin domain-containing protein [Ktedonobacteraceae bacterium]|nr:redoxin domain-containing protein [Ktedonobacteraceae bacterium]
MTDTKQPIEQAQAYVPKLQKDDIIPSFTLPGTDGMPHSPWTYKQIEHLVLLFTRSVASNETRGLLRAFAQEYTIFREEDCAILAITPDTVIANLAAQETLNLPYPLLADPKGGVIARYTYWDSDAKMPVPSIVLADRYNALYQQWVAKDEANLPPIEEIMESLQYINKLCTP